MRSSLVFTISLVVAVFALWGGAAVSQASPGNLRILLDSNLPGELQPGLVAAIEAEPGVATVDTFNSSTGTIAPSTLATYDLVIDTGDSDYADPATWGNELAAYLNAGGALIQFAYDNWDSSGASPTGAFASGGYAPFIPGPNDNLSTSLGTILVPSSPLLTGVSTLSTSDNTTDALAPGATLLALWADGRNAIATKGRVESVTASLDEDSFSPLSTVAQLVVNAGNVLGRHVLTVKKTGTGTGTVTSSPAGIDCGSTCTSDYAYGQSVTLTAKPSSKSTAALTGAGCSGTATCTLTVSSATTVTAKFTSKKRPHDTRITKAKVNKTVGTASFHFTASGTVTKFQCALLSLKAGEKVPKPVFRTCKSPKAYKHLGNGSYKFEVRAVNSAGPDRKAAVKAFTIAKPTPTFTGGRRIV